MNIPDSKQLYQAVTRKKPLDTGFAKIEHDRLYMPEHLTQLYHTSAYNFLNKEQKLRYNQLFALRSIEQLMTLEARFIELVLRRTSRNPHINKNEQLLHCMQEMIEEEKQHYQMFHSINVLAEPGIYANRSMYFARFTLPEQIALTMFTVTPGITLFMLWILLVLEEFSTYVSKQMIKAWQHSPDRLEPSFVKVHREHLKDETRHVAICANLISTMLDQTSPAIVKINALLLRKFMYDYMTPKRGGIRVIKHLVNEFPGLAIHENDMISVIRAQKQDKIIFEAIQNPDSMPFSHSLFQQHPDFCFFRAQSANLF
jgi:hypothetical protein